jgi:putative two-component system response regulator
MYKARKDMGDFIVRDKKHEILIIDDNRENMELLNNFLTSKGYRARSALNAKMALESIEARQPDLILLDIKMPGMSGFELCQELKRKSKTINIPIIFITAKNDLDTKIEAFKLGGVDYITKPFANEEVVARVSTHLKLSDYQHNLEENIKNGLYHISMLNNELELTQREMITTLSSLMETRDDDTGKHVSRVGEFSKLLAKLYGLDKKSVELIRKASPMHDVGKVAIPDNILNKPGKFEPEEWEIMKSHAIKGYEIFKNATSPVLQMAAIIAKEHHERWDGKGYPFGLKGKEINIAGRIVILADVFDALTHDRVYKKAWSTEESVEFIKENRGKMFEPKVVDIFIENLDAFVKIKEKLKD